MNLYRKTRAPVLRFQTKFIRTQIRRHGLVHLDASISLWDPGSPGTRIQSQLHAHEESSDLINTSDNERHVQHERERVDCPFVRR